MEPVVLTDKSIYPSDDILQEIIGNKLELWKEILNYLYSRHNQVTEEWKFYNDGKCWLYRSLKKKKTIFWVGVQKDTFRVTFYLNERAAPMIEQSALPAIVKEQYRNAKQNKFGRCLTIVMSAAEDAETVKILSEIKTKI